jgi:ketosteroid isomerase-like protein
MKNIIFLLAINVLVLACNPPAKEETPEAAASPVVMPYTATYSSQFNNDASDQDVLLVLNSYKAWENADMPALRSTFGDSLSFNRWDGTVYSGLTEGVTDNWAVFRDSLSSVKIKIGAWSKNHSIDKNENFILVWYREIDTYKSGKIDSAEWHDINQVKDGKITWYAQYKRPFAK